MHWQRHLEAYLGGRESLKGLILMMDIRHPMTDFDLLMLDWAVAAGMPMHILLTKADKLTYGAAKNTLLKVQAEIRKGWGDAGDNPAVFGTETHGPGRRLHRVGRLDGTGGQGCRSSSNCWLQVRQLESGV